MTTNSFASAFTKPWQNNNPVIPEDHEKSNMKYGRLVPAFKTGFPVFKNYIGMTTEPDFFESQFENISEIDFYKKMMGGTKYENISYADIVDDDNAMYFDIDSKLYKLYQLNELSHTKKGLTKNEQKIFKDALKEFNAKYTGGGSDSDSSDGGSDSDSSDEDSVKSYNTTDAESDAEYATDYSTGDDEEDPYWAKYDKMRKMMKQLISDDDLSDEDDWSDEDDLGDEDKGWGKDDEHLKEIIKEIESDELAQLVKEKLNDIITQLETDELQRVEKEEEEEAAKEANEKKAAAKKAAKEAKKNEIKAITAVYNANEKFNDLTKSITIDKKIYDANGEISDDTMKTFHTKAGQEGMTVKTGKYGQNINKEEYLQMGSNLEDIIDDYDEGDYDGETVKILIKFATKYKETWRWDSGSDKRKKVIEDMLELWKLNKF